MIMKVNNLIVSESGNSVFYYYPYGTILWLKQQDGTCSQVKVVGMECGHYDDTNTRKYIIHTYKFPNGNIVKGTIETTPMGRLRANLEDAKTYEWDCSFNTPYEHLFPLMRKASVYELAGIKYNITRENIGLWGANRNSVALFDYKLKADGTCRLFNTSGEQLHFDISYDKDKELEIAVEEFDNHTFYINRNQALANYHPKVEYFAEEDNEEEKAKETSRNVTITLDSNVLELLDAFGIKYQK